jgi:hypothetical protein
MRVALQYMMLRDYGKQKCLGDTFDEEGSASK